MCNDGSLSTAVSGEDYNAYNGTIYFGSCDTRKCVNITIIDDLIVENVECFQVMLNMNTSDLELNPMIGRVHIYSDESKNSIVINMTI